MTEISDMYRGSGVGITLLLIAFAVVRAGPEVRDGLSDYEEYPVTGRDLSYYTQRLDSSDDEIRREGMRQFAVDGPEQFGSEAVRLIRQGILDSNEEVQEFAVYALQRLAWSGTQEVQDPDLLQRLLRIVTDHPESKVAVEAANTYGVMNGVTTDGGRSGGTVRHQSGAFGEQNSQAGTV